MPAAPTQGQATPVAQVPAATILLVPERDDVLIGPAAGCHPRSSGEAPCACAIATTPLSERGIEHAITVGLTLRALPGAGRRPSLWAAPRLRSLQSARIAAASLREHCSVNTDARLTDISIPGDVPTEAELRARFRSPRLPDARCPARLRTSQEVLECLDQLVEELLGTHLPLTRVLFAPRKVTDILLWRYPEHARLLHDRGQLSRS